MCWASNDNRNPSLLISVKSVNFDISSSNSNHAEQDLQRGFVTKLAKAYKTDM